MHPWCLWTPENSPMEEKPLPKGWIAFWTSAPAQSYLSSWKSKIRWIPSISGTVKRVEVNSQNHSGYGTEKTLPKGAKTEGKDKKGKSLEFLWKNNPSPWKQVLTNLHTKEVWSTSLFGLVHPGVLGTTHRSHEGHGALVQGARGMEKPLVSSKWWAQTSDTVQSPS